MIPCLLAPASPKCLCFLTELLPYSPTLSSTVQQPTWAFQQVSAYGLGLWRQRRKGGEWHWKVDSILRIAKLYNVFSFGFVEQSGIEDRSSTTLLLYHRSLILHSSLFQRYSRARNLKP